MIDNFNSIQSIEDVPFAAIMRRTGTTPVLLDFLVPEMDLVIWQMRPCVGHAVDMELRQAALRTLDGAVHYQGEERGAMIYEFDGYSFFAFQRADRDRVLAELGVRRLESW